MAAPVFEDLPEIPEISEPPEVQPEDVSQPEHLLTPANVMTASRPLIAARIGHKLLAGEPGVTPLMLTMAVSDAEGNVARAIDKLFPGSGYGTTEIGTAIDPIADTTAFLGVAAAALKAPRVSRLGKAAVGVVLGAEGVKAAWALQAAAGHRAETGGQLIIRPSVRGKLSAAGKYAALTAAVATHDLEPGPKRTLAGAAALGTALLSAFHGEKARRGYRRGLAAVASS